MATSNTRITQEVAEVTGEGSGGAIRISQVVIEVLTPTSVDVFVTQELVETLSSGTIEFHVTQLIAEAPGSGTINTLVTQIIAEVLSSPVQDGTDIDVPAETPEDPEIAAEPPTNPSLLADAAYICIDAMECDIDALANAEDICKDASD